MSATAAKPSATPLQTRATPISKDVAVEGRRFVYGFSAVYAAIFVAAAATNYLLYLEPRLDLGDMVQAVWSTAHGHFLQTSTPNGVAISRLGAHFDPFLALLVPLWWIWSSPLVLLGAQAVAVASGALPVYWLARKHLSNGRVAAVFATAYLLYSPTQFNTFTPIGIHAVSFATPLILYAIWFLDQDRLVPFAIFAALAATTKEEIAAAVGGLGIWYAVRRGRRRVGAAIFVLGTLLSVVSLELVIPHYAPSGASPFAGRYTGVGGTPGGMLHVAVTDPIAFLHQAVTLHKILFLVLVFAPFLGLWALEPVMLVGAVPDLAINLLSSKPEQTTIFYQYTAGIIPFVVAASVLGMARVRRQRFVPTAMVAIFALLAVVSPLVYTADSLHVYSKQQRTAIRRALHIIPPKAPVSASLSLGGYVSTRREVANFPLIGQARWVIVGRKMSVDSPRRYKRVVARLNASPRWKTAFHSSGVTVFERRD